MHLWLEKAIIIKKFNQLHKIQLEIINTRMTSKLIIAMKLIIIKLLHSAFQTVLIPKLKIIVAKIKLLVLSLKLKEIIKN